MWISSINHAMPLLATLSIECTNPRFTIRGFHRRPPSAPHSTPPCQFFGYRRALSLPILRHSRPAQNSHVSLTSFDSKRDEPMNDYLDVEFKVRDYELDQYGVVNNAVFASYCQHAQHELLSQKGFIPDDFAQVGEAWANSELSIKFIKPLRSGDMFVVRVKVKQISAARIYFEYLIYKLPNLEPILEAKATGVYLDKNYRPLRLPSDIRSKLL